MCGGHPTTVSLIFVCVFFFCSVGKGVACANFCFTRIKSIIYIQTHRIYNWLWVELVLPFYFIYCQNGMRCGIFKLLFFPNTPCRCLGKRCLYKLNQSTFAFDVLLSTERDTKRLQRLQIVYDATRNVQEARHYRQSIKMRYR